MITNFTAFNSDGWRRPMPKSKSDLIEKLKGLYKKRKKIINGLESYTVPVLRQLIKAEEEAWTCRSCGGQLTVMKWNEQADIITCNNAGCTKFHSPVETIKKRVNRVILYD